MRTRHLPILIALLAPACADVGVDADADAPPPSSSEVTRPFAVAITGLGDQGITIELVNGREVDAEAAVKVSVASSAGLVQTHALRLERLAPLERLELTLPRAELPGFDGAAQLTVTADVEFDDGERRSPTSTPLAVVADGASWQPGDPEEPIVSRRPRRDTVAELEASIELDDRSLGREPAADLIVARRLCMRVSTEYDDAGIGETYWTSSGATLRTIRGADIRVWHDGTSFSGKLGDGLGGSHAGCLEISGRGIKTGDLLFVELFTSGRVNGHDVRVQTQSDSQRASDMVGVFYTEQTEDWHDLTPGESKQERFNVYMAATYALYRHGGTAGASLTIHTDATGGSRANSTTVWIADGEDHEKFSIAHEVGHYVARNSGAGFGNADSCGTYRTGVGKPCDAVGHSFTSKELVRCAAVEGWADFYAADVFNDHDGVSCWITINGSENVNCQVGNAGFPEAMMESNCQTPYAGYGVETDWMRVFWDVHTRGSDVPSLNDMLRWIAASDDSKAWTDKNVYDLLNAEAIRRDDNLATNWVDVRDTHGIDHPTQ